MRCAKETTLNWKGMNVLMYDEGKDKRLSGLITSSILLLLFIWLYLTTIPQADPPLYEKIYPEVQMGLEVPPELMKIAEAGGGGGGSGTPSNDKVVKTPQPQTAKIVTQNNSDSDVKLHSGNSNKTNGKNLTNTASTTEKSNNPFGSGGSGGGDNGGRGTGVGTTDGSGDGNGGPGAGVGDGKGRIRYNDPDNENIYSDEPHVIKLKLLVDSQGNVVDGDAARGTTTTDLSMIKQVIANCKKQVKYSKKPGAGLEFTFLTVNISAR